MKKNLVYRNHDAEQKFLRDKKSKKIDLIKDIVYWVIILGSLVTLGIIFMN